MTLLRRARPSAQPLGAAANALVSVIHQEVLLRTRPLPETCRRLGIELRLDGTVGREACGHPLRLTSRERETARWCRRWLRLGPLPDTCLRRALAAAQCFRSGHRVALQIGVAIAPTSSRNLAHAWVVVDGHVNDPMARQFTVLTPIGHHIAAPQDANAAACSR